MLYPLLQKLRLLANSPVASLRAYRRIIFFDRKSRVYHASQCAKFTVCLPGSEEQIALFGTPIVRNLVVIVGTKIFLRRVHDEKANTIANYILIIVNNNIASWAILSNAFLVLVVFASVASVHIVFIAVNNIVVIIRRSLCLR